MRRLHLSFIDPLWIRISGFLVVMFFVLLSDAILSDFVPVYVQNTVGSPLLMGYIMASSSLVGLLLDLIFPQLLRSSGVKKLAGMAMVGSLAFIASLFGSTFLPSMLILFAGMAAWGVYYELDSFMTKQFVADSAPAHARGAVWGIMGVFRNLAYFLGPLLGAGLVSFGDRGVLLIAGAILLIAYLFFMYVRIPQKTEEEGTEHEIHVVAEIKHWISLGSVAWPVLMLSVLAGIIDAVFWTTGTLVNDMLAEVHPAGGWFLSVYMLPSLFVGFAIAKWGIYTGKKMWAERFLFVGGLTLMGIVLSQNVWWILGVVFVSSIFFGLSWPLVDAVYSDFAVRMKKGRKHMIGMSSSTLSLAYIIGPILAGSLAGHVGEVESFAWIGGGVMVVAGVLLFITPRKIRLPEKDIETWDTAHLASSRLVQ